MAKPKNSKTQENAKNGKIEEENVEKLKKAETKGAKKTDETRAVLAQEPGNKETEGNGVEEKITKKRGRPPKNGGNIKNLKIKEISKNVEISKNSQDCGDEKGEILQKVAKEQKSSESEKSGQAKAKQTEKLKIATADGNGAPLIEAKVSKRKGVGKKDDIVAQDAKKLKIEENLKNGGIEAEKSDDSNGEPPVIETKMSKRKGAAKKDEIEAQDAKKLKSDENLKNGMAEAEKSDLAENGTSLAEAKKSKRKVAEKMPEAESQISGDPKVGKRQKNGKIAEKPSNLQSAEKKKNGKVVEAEKFKGKAAEKRADEPEVASASGTEKSKVEKIKKKDKIAEKLPKSKPTTAKSKKTDQSAAEAAGEKSEKREGGPKMKKLLLAGPAPVDPECRSKLGKAQVFRENDVIYDCMLNQTNIDVNNNKFYLLQLLKDDDANLFNVWFRWGRVGFSGQNNLVSCGSSLTDAKEVFCKKFNEKTKNHWGDKKNFQKVHGKYDLIEVDYSSDDKLTENAKSDVIKNDELAEKKIVECKLDQRVQDLLKLICDVKRMEQTVKEMEYDAQKAPLGKLTKSQIKAGYEALKKIEVLLDQSPAASSSALLQACSEFYTRIPHAFGMKTPPLIRDKEMLKQKMDLLETLSDIEVAIRILKDEKGGQNMHPLDKHYGALNRDLKPIERCSDEFRTIETYLLNTHAQTHNSYKLKLLDLFACSKSEEDSWFMKDIGNNMLLWHGSRLSNFFGILNQGLRIAPPEAPCTGYMFGKGVYFADCASKSTNYCFATKRQNIGLVVLSEVALGKCNELTQSNFNAHKLPPGFSSTKGVGRFAPDPEATVTMGNGVKVPLGQLINDSTKQTSVYPLSYNEYIVYNTKQIKMKYLAKIEFDFV